MQLQELPQRRGVLEPWGACFQKRAGPREGTTWGGAKASQPRGPALPPPRRAGALGRASAGGTSAGKCLWLHTPRGLREHGGHMPWKCFCPRTQPVGPQLATAPMPRGTHAAQVPHSAGLCFLFPHQVGASGDKGAALVRALQRPRQGRCRRGVRQGRPMCGRAGPGLTCCTRPWSGTPPPCRTPRWCCTAGSRGGRTSWLQGKGGT